MVCTYISKPNKTCCKSNFAAPTVNPSSNTPLIIKDRSVIDDGQCYVDIPESLYNEIPSKSNIAEPTVKPISNTSLISKDSSLSEILMANPTI